MGRKTLLDEVLTMVTKTQDGKRDATRKVKGGILHTLFLIAVIISLASLATLLLDAFLDGLPWLSMHPRIGSLLSLI